MWKSNFYGAFVLNNRVVLHAIDATPARRRGGAGSSPLDRARTAAPSPRGDLVKNSRVHPSHWLISTQVMIVQLEDWRTPSRARPPGPRRRLPSEANSAGTNWSRTAPETRSSGTRPRGKRGGNGIPLGYKKSTRAARSTGSLRVRRGGRPGDGGVGFSQQGRARRRAGRRRSTSSCGPTSWLVANYCGVCLLPPTPSSRHVHVSSLLAPALRGLRFGCRLRRRAHADLRARVRCHAAMVQQSIGKLRKRDSAIPINI